MRHWHHHRPTNNCQCTETYRKATTTIYIPAHSNVRLLTCACFFRKQSITVLWRRNNQATERLHIQTHTLPSKAENRCSRVPYRPAQHSRKYIRISKGDKDYSLAGNQSNSNNNYKDNNRSRSRSSSSNNNNKWQTKRSFDYGTSDTSEAVADGWNSCV